MPVNDAPVPPVAIPQSADTLGFVRKALSANFPYAKAA